MVNPEDRTLRRTRNEVQRHEAAALFRNLGNSNRLAILGALLGRERAVGELETELGIRQPILSQQLAILREAGLLETTRDRKSIVYRLVDRHAPVVARVLHAVLEPTAEARHPVEAPAAAKPRAEPFLAAAVFGRVDQGQNG